jgi:iron complex transport system substrate-binding protein
VADVLSDIQTVGDACESSHVARELVSTINERIACIKRHQSYRPRVLCLEWLDPPFVGGHWVPEMVELAGGVDVLGRAGEPGYEVDWTTILSSDPDVVLVMPCGYHRQGVERELEIVPFPPEWQSLRAVRNRNVFAMDASSHFSRPGPRIVDGIVEMNELFLSLNTRLKKGVSGTAQAATAQLREGR